MSINGTGCRCRLSVLADVGNPMGEATVRHNMYGNQAIVRCFVPAGGV